MTTIYRIEISTKPVFPDARGEKIRRQVAALGINALQSVSVTDLYFLRGNLSVADVQHLTATLLHDPVVEDVAWYPLDAPPARAPQRQQWCVEVVLHAGVTDSEAESLLDGARIIGLTGLEEAATGQRYTVSGDIAESDLHRIARGLLANEIIQTYTINHPAAPPFVSERGRGGDRERGRLSPLHPLSPSPPLPIIKTIPLTNAADADLEAISRERRLSLDLAEMQAIQAYYRRKGREPTDVELEMLAQTWSEHCLHKTFKALISYQGGKQTHLEIDSLLKTYIQGATEKANKPWIRSAFVDNAGIIAFDDHFDLAFKMETHNHPSALEPFGGANTGVGGVVRDVIGVSARPIANTDVLCFGPQDMTFDALPAGVLHPRRISEGVVAGIEDYGNKMGIPTVNGALCYNPGYTANPLVFCGCLGILPRGSHPTEAQVDDLVIVIGGRIGRDGLRGATFSSMEMTHETGEIAGSAVQIGHPIHEKQFLEAIMQARDEQLYTAITDCGAGGLSSAVGEMAEELGAAVHLERAPLKYPGLTPWEIWLSEAQERMVLAAPPENWPRLRQICEALDVEATELGVFTGDGQLRIYYEDQLVGDIDSHFLFNGVPRRHLQAVWTPPKLGIDELTNGRIDGHSPSANSQIRKFVFTPAADLTPDLLALLAHPDTRSKEDIVRQYDHEVQGGTVVKPFVGPQAAGPGDAAVVSPITTAIDDFRFQIYDNHSPIVNLKSEIVNHKGAALSVGINPAYGQLDPHAMAWAAVDEAFRNCVAVGADPDQIALLDNFCWGNPNLPDRLGSLVRAAQGCYDAAVAYGAPFISGKDSLNNEYTGADGKKHAIPGTILISALGIVPDITRTTTSDLKQPGSILYAIGLTRRELGGSTYLQHHNFTSQNVPRPQKDGMNIFRALHRAIKGGLAQACHDCSEGGLTVAAAEMAFAGGLGVEINLLALPHTKDAAQDHVLAFSESLTRFVVEVSPENAAAFEATFAHPSAGSEPALNSLKGQALPAARIGLVRSDDRVQFIGLEGEPVIQTDLQAIEKAWKGHF